MAAGRHHAESVGSGAIVTDRSGSRRSSVRGGARAGDAFLGTDRYAVEGILGEGGMGVVYRARDLERGGLVALKTILHESPAAILEFKREFRTLAEFAHPNVVDLHELVQDGGTWFFTMELVEGTSLLEYVWHGPSQEPRGKTGATDHTLDAPTWLGVAATERQGAAASPTRGGLPASPAVDEARLRDAIGQLADGIAAIHDGGKLHCDIKPTNVLCTPRGRVVVLDFGIAVAQGDDPLGSGDRRPRGTPAYMAPEQAALLPLGPPADWYAVGAMLYEALTGRLPFEGPLMAMLLAKQKELPLPPGEVARGIPEDLAALAMDLLAPRAEDRPTGAEVLARLGWQQRALSRRVPPQPSQAASFIGRERERMALHEALLEARSGKLTTAFLSGRSGMGKSALAGRFLADVRAIENTVVLEGRCYEREAVPYKAFDSLFDALARHLGRLSPERRSALLPPDVHALGRLFPALSAVAPPDSERTAVALDDMDPKELRRRAFAAAKELLRRLASSRLLVLHIDDVQWGDADSVRLLDAILEPPDAPPMLLLLSYRSEQESTSEMLIETKHLRARRGARSIELRELSEGEAVEVARELLRRGGRAPLDVAPVIARESGGSPFFVQELVHYEEDRAARTTGRNTTSAPASLDEVLLARIERLPPESRRLLDVVAVGCGPLELDVAFRAATLGRLAFAPLAALRSAKLVRTYRQDERGMIETFHDRVRQVVHDAMPLADRKAAHARLASELSASGRADPETLVSHYLGAERREEARRYAVIAADAASRSLAFVRAARLYAVAIELGGADVVLLRKHADALADAGRGVLAGRAYLVAAARAEGFEAHELRRLAAESMLKAGLEDEGRAVLEDVLRGVGESYPATHPRTVVGLVLQRVRLAATPLSFQARAECDVPPRLLAKVDAAYTATVGLSLTDPIRGVYFGERQLALALSSREPFRVCRALALAAAGRSAEGVAARPQAERLMRAAEALAATLDHPETVALARLAAGNVPFFFGEWKQARAALDEAEALLRTRCRNVAWERTNTHFQGCNVRIFMGDLGEAARRVPGIVREALERNDLFALSNMTYVATVTHLAADDVAQARNTTQAYAEPFAQGTFSTGQWGALVSAVSVERYEGNGRGALARMHAEWPRLEASLLMRVELVRVTSLFERGLCAVAASLDRGSHLDEAEALARRLLREPPPYARAMGEQLHAAVAAARGRTGEALGWLDRAVPSLERADLGYLAACARARRGAMRGGMGGAVEHEGAIAWLEAKGVRAPLKCLRMSVPDRSDAT